ncbi:MAG: hypothetical protein GAK39_04280 [Variovorax sp.]|nr:MAG: hypothetical protein GAK39_04280 [Variovorax sp.]
MSSGIAPVFKGLVSHPWAYPALEAVHIVGIAMLFGGLLVFELRALGLGRDLPAARLARLTLAPALAGFGLCAATGLAMFAGQPGELLANPAFRLKLLLIALAGANAALFHARGGSALLDGPAAKTGRLQCLLSLAFWLAVIVCGRWIAYA